MGLFAAEISDGTLLGVASAVVVSLAGVVSLLYREQQKTNAAAIAREREAAAALIAAKEWEHQAALDREAARVKELESMKKPYAEIAGEAIKAAATTGNMLLARNGKPPVPILPPVISESHSPSTPKQREEADIQTLRARMAAIKKAVGLDPREEPERGEAKEGESPKEEKA